MLKRKNLNFSNKSGFIFTVFKNIPQPRLVVKKVPVDIMKHVHSVRKGNSYKLSINSYAELSLLSMFWQFNILQRTISIY